MGYDVYFYNGEVTKDMWKYFINSEYILGGCSKFTLISGFTRRDAVAINPNGEAYFFTSEGLAYEGIWFDIMPKNRVVIFSNKSVI